MPALFMHCVYHRNSVGGSEIKTKPQIIIHFMLPDESISSRLWKHLKFQLLIGKVIDMAAVQLGFGRTILPLLSNMSTY